MCRFRPTNQWGRNDLNRVTHPAGACALLGIDISSSSVKLVELGRSREGVLMLERCGIEPLERGWISEGNVEKFDEVVGALRRLLRKCGSKTRRVALACRVPR